MRFDFWNELPKALIDILNNQDTYDQDIAKAQLFESTNRQIDLEIKMLKQNDITDTDIMMIINKKLDLIQKERTEFTCQAIKFTISLISQFLKNFDLNTDKFKNAENLSKIKIFLQISKLIVKTANSEIDALERSQNRSENQIKFFNMIATFTEKSQTEIYVKCSQIIGQN